MHPVKGSRVENLFETAKKFHRLFVVKGDDAGTIALGFAVTKQEPYRTLARREFGGFALYDKDEIRKWR